MGKKGGSTKKGAGSSERVRGKFEVTKFSKGREFKTKGDWFSLSDW